MMVSPDYGWAHRREAWEDPAHTVDRHTTSGPFPWAACDTFVIHYTAAPKIPGDIPAYLRAIQRDYITSRHGGPEWMGADGQTYDGYSIGYSAAVTNDNAAEVWELRGVRCQAAATSGWNGRSFACLVLVDGAEPCSAAAIDRVRDLVRFVRANSPNTVTIRGHQECGPTACPGVGVQSQIEAGVFEPVDQGVNVATSYEIHPAPQRILDSRKFGVETGRIGSDRAGDNGVRSIRVPGALSAVGVEATITLIDARLPGYATVWASGARPTASCVNTAQGVAAIANTTTVPLDASGSFQIYVKGDAHLAVDIVGVHRS